MRKIRRTQWTQEEDERLWERFIAGDSDEEIAKALNRSPLTIQKRRGMLKLLRVKSPSARPTDWTGEDLRRLIELFHHGASDLMMSEALGRTYAAVRARRRVLRLLRETPI